MSRELDDQKIRDAVAALKPNGELFEVRVLLHDRKKSVLSGYFTDADTLLEAFKKVNLEGGTVYFTLNRLNAQCGARPQRDRFVLNPNTTNDGEITDYEYLFIDMDPVRITGISSSNDELQKAVEMARSVYSYLRELGFREPIKALSGNGCHLLYRIDLPNTQENADLVKRCLETLADIFNNDSVKIDAVNFNPSRICKLYGTLAQKGSNTADRPHRMSRMFTNIIPKVNGRDLLVALAGDVNPCKPAPSQSTFDLLDFMAKNGMDYQESDGRECKIYALDACPFDPSHRNGDSKIFRYNDGAIAFKCHHNSCRNYRWQDVRRKYDTSYGEMPEDDGHIEAGVQKLISNRQKESRAEHTDLDVTVEHTDMPIWFTPAEIFAMPDQEEEYIATGYDGIDSKLGGLVKGGLTVVSGLRGSAKSTWLSQVVLNAVEQRCNVIYYSGELTSKKLNRWLIRQAAGSQNRMSTKRQGFYYVPDDVSKEIVEWIGDYLTIYNNEYGNNFAKMRPILQQKILDMKADLVVLDNLMALDIRNLASPDMYAAQSAFVGELKRMAQTTNSHIVFVAHPRKASGFMRLEDISGSNDIVNRVDNALVVHRVNEDFRVKFPETFGKQRPLPDGTNVIEICKDRENGTQDEFISLWYDEASKQLNESIGIKRFGWSNGDEKMDSFNPAAISEVPF